MKNKAFTLIELLVVILIIGILAAIALPKYQIAVIKSQYGTLKILVESIVRAQERYYLSNGKYAEDFTKLDIELPSGRLENTSPSYYYFDWGYCWLYPGRYATCFNDSSQMQYTHRYANLDTEANLRTCAFVIAYNTPGLKSKPQYKVCNQETGRKDAQRGTTTAHSWDYP